MSNVRRCLHSVTLYRPDKAFNGFTLFAPMAGDPGNAWLIDMQGRLVHRWQLAGQVALQAVLLPTGNLLYGIRHPQRSIPGVPLSGGQLIEVDWDNNVVWQYDEPHMHTHDWIRMKNGNTMIMKFVPLPEDFATKVKGGVPGTENNGVIWADTLQEITPDGKVVWEWAAQKHLDPELDAITPLCARYAWPYWNSLVELADGNIMTCSPFTSKITIIDRTSGEIKWRWGYPEVSWPHNPSMLDNGNILVFDNGRHRPHLPVITPPDFSRVIEVNPGTLKIEWEYRSDNPVDFYGTFLSGCERLPNGNTLVCEGSMGRFFEINVRGEMVWEYVVPFYDHHTSGRFGLTNLTFRAHRYGPDYPGLHGKKLDSEDLSLWNRLYGPEAFSARAQPFPALSVSKMPVTEEKRPHSQERSPAKEERKPGLGKPGEDKLRSRLDRLGY